MEDYKELSKEEKQRISDYIQKTHQGYMEESPSFERSSVSDFMDNFYKKIVVDLVKDNIVAEGFTMKREDFDNEIVKSLSKIYSKQISKQIKDKMHSLLNPVEFTFNSEIDSEIVLDPFDDEIAAVEDLLEGKATERQIYLVTRKYKNRIAQAKRDNTPEGKERLRLANEKHLAKPGNKERKKIRDRDNYNTPEGKKRRREVNQRYLAKPGNKEKAKEKRRERNLKKTSKKELTIEEEEKKAAKKERKKERKN